MQSKDLSFHSICASEVEEIKINPSHILPIHPTSAFEFDSLQESIDIFSKKKKGYLYSRYANPTTESVASKIALLESYQTDRDVFCLLTNSGMSAISLLFMSAVSQGQKVLTQGNLYGGTTELLVSVLTRLGIEPLFTDLNDLNNVDALLSQHSEIALVYAETPANPSLDCVDLRALVEVAKRNGVKTAIDNTFCTPYIQRPLTFGIDYIVHSTTKALNGHGNMIGGALIADRSDFDLFWNTYKLIGLNPGPFDVWLLHNGMKTLTVRMDKACSNAQAIAEYLEKHPKIERVNYPGLHNHPAHAIASKQMKQFGAMLSFVLKDGLVAGKQFSDQVKLITCAPTLGDLHTLILHPASSSHLNVSDEIRREAGISDGLIRMSVGIESTEDLINDIEQALNS